MSVRSASRYLQAAKRPPSETAGRRSGGLGTSSNSPLIKFNAVASLAPS